MHWATNWCSALFTSFNRPVMQRLQLSLVPRLSKLGGGKGQREPGKDCTRMRQPTCKYPVPVPRNLSMRPNKHVELWSDEWIVQLILYKRNEFIAAGFFSFNTKSIISRHMRLLPQHLP